ncbi:MAG: translation elongation factor 4 [bacterium]|nr:translation elongation factor 4 [bacterium]
MQSHIRNFCIIAHIDHGKSTLADRLLEHTGTVERRDMREQLLDSMDLERERGITIKLQPVTMRWKPPGAPDADIFELNLIDTPGHVDFSYEVSRTLSACEGALLLVDATQGIQAQTIAHALQAKEQGLRVIPVINKIDLPAAEPEDTAKAVAETLKLPEDDVVFVSAKTGDGVAELLEAIRDRVPSPAGDPLAPLRALVFDSYFDSYQGVIAYVRVVDGALPARLPVHLMAAGRGGEAQEVGVLTPERKKLPELATGSIGFMVTGLKDLSQVRVGDTVTAAGTPAEQPLPGYRVVAPMVFAGLFVQSGSEFAKLRDALDRLSLHDASFSFEPVQSQALGQGFRCGFLGLLHLDIIRERLTREFGLELVVTAPTVPYEVRLTDGREETVTDPAELPDPTKIAETREPWAKLEVVCRGQDLGAVQQLIADRRGEFVGTSFASSDRVLVEAELPLANLVADFYDQLKGVTAGYGSLAFERTGFRAAPLVRIDFLVAGDAVSGLSVIVHRDEAERRARGMLKKLQEVIPPALFEIALQAAIGGKVIARENIKPRKKDVTAGLYGGDVTRKRKLREKQKKGKARMKAEGNVRIPAEAFVAVLKQD